VVWATKQARLNSHQKVICQLARRGSPGLKSTSTKSVQNLISTIFPPQCLRCNRLEYALCLDCRRSIGVQRGDQLAGVAAVFSAGDYSGWLRDAVLAYKSGRQSNVDGLASVLLQVLEVSQLSADYLVGIPSTKAKVESRGFDTIGNLCSALSRKTKIRHVRALKFAHRVTSQVGLTRDQRLQNLNQAFCATRAISGNVLLVDDVITTGATMSAAAQKLRIAGAKNIFAISLCRTQ